jgi:hypothetical protein
MAKGATNLLWRKLVTEVLFPDEEDEDWEGEERPEPQKPTPQQEEENEPGESSGSAEPQVLYMNNTDHLQELHDKLKPKIKNKRFEAKMSKRMSELRHDIRSGHEKKISSALNTLERLNSLIEAF